MAGEPLLVSAEAIAELLVGESDEFAAPTHGSLIGDVQDAERVAVKAHEHERVTLLTISRAEERRPVRALEIEDRERRRPEVSECGRRQKAWRQAIVASDGSVRPGGGHVLSSSSMRSSSRASRDDTLRANSLR